jgi:hypothetical protein
VKAPTGKFYSVKNIKRGLTTSNLLTPNQYTSLGYSVSTSILGDAANYVNPGENELHLLEGDRVVGRAIMTASCATGSTWDGKICSTGGSTGSGSTPTTPITGKVVDHIGEKLTGFNTARTIYC